jgi:hypothetical protein
MTDHISKSRRSLRETWSRDHLLRERAIVIACAIEPSSVSSYSSAVKCYFDFCSEPKSVLSYLSGICNQLEPFFPEVRTHRQHWLVTKTLAGCRKMFPSTVSRKRPITRSELAMIARLYTSSSSYDDILFLAILLTGSCV